MRIRYAVIPLIVLLAGCATTNLEKTGSATGLGASPFVAGGSFTPASANAMNNAINDNDDRLDTIEALVGPVFSVGDGTYTDLSAISATELGYLNGVTSAIQTQFSAKVSTTAIDTEAELESVSNTQIATETEAQGYVTYEQLNTNSDIDTNLSDGATASTVPSSAGVVAYYTVTSFALSDGASKSVHFITVPAGETVAAFAPVYGKYDAGQTAMAIYNYDADGADSDAYFPLGVAATGGDVTDSLTIWVEQALLVRRDELDFATSTWGKPFYASTTAGGVSSTKPSTTDDYIFGMGIIINADYLLYKQLVPPIQVP